MSERKKERYKERKKRYEEKKAWEKKRKKRKEGYEKGREEWGLKSPGSTGSWTRQGQEKITMEAKS